MDSKKWTFSWIEIFLSLKMKDLGTCNRCLIIAKMFGKNVGNKIQ